MGEKKRTIVEINGRRYDAVTGAIIEKTPTTNKVIDGFAAPKTSAKRQSAQPQKVTSVTRNVNTSHSIHSKPQKTKKLHPAAAAKVVASKTITAKSRPTHSNQSHAAMKSTPRGAAVSNTLRAERAATHTKNPLINRFTSSSTALEATQPAPTVKQTDTPALRSTMPKHQAVAKPNTTTPTQVLSAAEKNATSDEDTSSAKKSFKPRLMPIGVMSLALLAIAGYVTYQNIPNMALRVASQRAGFSASLPGYKPAGFSFGGPVVSTDGVIQLGYDSNSDDRNFTVTQKESNWDSKSLLDNFVTQRSDDYLTFQERGLTIYVYDQSNATWVDGGIWYTIEGDSLLTSEQLLKIAGSL